MLINIHFIICRHMCWFTHWEWPGLARTWGRGYPFVSLFHGHLFVNLPTLLPLCLPSQISIGVEWLRVHQISRKYALSLDHLHSPTCSWSSLLTLAPPSNTVDPVKCRICYEYYGILLLGPHPR